MPKGYIIEFTDEIDGNCNTWEVDPETIGQFIINEDGNDIYEGDIIQEFKHGVLKRQFIANDIRTFIREYDKAEHDSKWKIVGTIHDQAEVDHE